MAKRVVAGTDALRVMEDGSVRLGNTTSYVQTSPTGQMTFAGSATYFDDLRVEPTVRGTGGKVPAYSAYKGGIYVYIFDNAALAAEKEVNFKMQLPHGWLEQSAVHLHIHWTPIVTGNLNDKVRWGLEYTVARIGGTFNSPGAIRYADTPVNPPSATPTADVHYLTEFADIDMALRA